MHRGRKSNRKARQAARTAFYPALSAASSSNPAEQVRTHAPVRAATYLNWESYLRDQSLLHGVKTRPPTDEAMTSFSNDFQSCRGLFHKLRRTTRFLRGLNSVVDSYIWLKALEVKLGADGNGYHDIQCAFQMWCYIAFPNHFPPTSIRVFMDCAFNQYLIHLIAPEALTHVEAQAGPCSNDCLPCTAARVLLQRCLYLNSVDEIHHRVCSYWQWISQLEHADLFKQSVDLANAAAHIQILPHAKILGKFATCPDCSVATYCLPSQREALDAIEESLSWARLIEHVYEMSEANKPGREIWSFLDIPTREKIIGWCEAYMDGPKIDPKDKQLFWRYLVECFHVTGGIRGWIDRCQEEKRCIQNKRCAQLTKLIGSPLVIAQAEFRYDPNCPDCISEPSCDESEESDKENQSDEDEDESIKEWQDENEEYVETDLVIIPRKEKLYDPDVLSLESGPSLGYICLVSEQDYSHICRNFSEPLNYFCFLIDGKKCFVVSCGVEETDQLAVHMSDCHLTNCQLCAVEDSRKRIHGTCASSIERLYFCRACQKACHNQAVHLFACNVENCLFCDAVKFKLDKRYLDQQMEHYAECVRRNGLVPQMIDLGSKKSKRTPKV